MRSNRTVVPASSRTRWLTVALVADVILAVSVIPIPGSVPDDGGGIPTSVLFHFFGYAVLAAALSIALASRRLRSTIGGAFTGASGYGALMEFVQMGLPYRAFSSLDMAINASGALLATVAMLVVAFLRRSE